MKKVFAAIKRFFTFTIKGGTKIDISYPTDWGTMSIEDFRNVCMILDQPHGKKESLFLCLCALAHIRPDNQIHYDPKKLKNNVAFIIGDRRYIISPKTIQEACSQLEFIYDTVGLAPSPLPKIDRKLYGVSFEQYYEADAYMLQYNASEVKDESLLKKVAIILTKGRTRKLLPWQRKGLVIWWAGVKQYLMEKYPYVLQEGGSISDRTQEEILQEILSCMNNDRPQENNAILKSDVHAVLYSLNNIFMKNAHK